MGGPGSRWKMIVVYYQAQADQLSKGTERPLPEGGCMFAGRCLIPLIRQFRLVDRQTKPKLTPDSKRPSPDSSQLTWSGFYVEAEAESGSD